MKLIKLTEDAFDKRFKPLENVEQGQGIYQFDAYDEKDRGFLQFMANSYPSHIWTRIDGDDGCVYAINGWHIVNRIDYLITEVPWQKHCNYEILDYAPINNAAL